MRPGMQVIFEKTPVFPTRIVSVPMSAQLAWSKNFEEALDVLSIAQCYAEMEYGPCDLELVATIQYGSQVPMGYMLHFEATPCLQ